MVVYWTFLTNYNLKFDLIKDNEEERVIRESYKPLLRLVKDLKLKSGHAFTGWTLEQINSYEPEILENVKKLLENKTIELVAHTYGHPVLTTIPLWEAEAQLEEGLNTELNLLSSKSTGFYPPEWFFDPTLPFIANKNNLEWMVLIGDNVIGNYGIEKEDILTPKIVRGINNSSIPCFFVYGGENLDIRNKMYAIIENKSSIDDLVESFSNSAGSKTKNPFIIFYMDSETPFFAKTDNNKYSFSKVEKIFESLLSNPNLKNISFNEYLSNFYPSSEIIPKVSESYKISNTWTERFEKLDFLIDECRNVIKQKLNSGGDKSEIMEAWKLLMLAEGSDVRSTIQPIKMKGIPITGRKVYGNFNRLIEGYEYALRALELLK